MKRTRPGVWIRLTAVPIALCFCICTAQTHARFPDVKTELRSPDGRYTIRSVDEGNSHNSVLVLDNTTGVSSKIYDYERSIGVVWSPDSRHLAINDYAGSNMAEAYILSVENPASRIDVQDELCRKAGLTPNRGHDYFGVAHWLNADSVEVHYWGHSDQPPAKAFCECYVYKLNGSVTRCAHQPQGLDLEELCSSTNP